MGRTLFAGGGFLAVGGARRPWRLDAPGSGSVAVASAGSVVVGGAFTSIG